MSVMDEAVELEQEDYMYRHAPRERLIELGLLCERCDAHGRCLETRAGEMLCDRCGRR